MTLPVSARGNADCPALVLLHGLAAAHRMWAPQVEPLAERFCLLVPDLPGYGDSPPTSGRLATARKMPSSCAIDSFVVIKALRIFAITPTF